MAGLLKPWRYGGECYPFIQWEKLSWDSERKALLPKPRRKICRRKKVVQTSQHYVAKRQLMLCGCLCSLVFFHHLAFTMYISLSNLGNVGYIGGKMCNQKLHKKYFNFVSFVNKKTSSVDTYHILRNFQSSSIEKKTKHLLFCLKIRGCYLR